MRYTILYHPDQCSEIRSCHLQPFWNEYFDIEPVDFNKTYDRSKYLFWRPEFPEGTWHLPYQDSGYRIVVGAFWENSYTAQSTIKDNVLYVRSPNWFRYNEALWYQRLGYHTYVPSRTYEKFFLMLMRLKKPHRDSLFKSASTYLPNSLYSYLARDIKIDHDGDDQLGHYQRYFSPTWYNTTCFSLVAETYVDRNNFISEKTFKPFAYGHPLVVWGAPDTLKYVRNLGFKTFDHCIDESYDSITDPDARLDAIMQVVESLYQKWINNHSLFSDEKSLSIIEHNRSHFYHPDIKWLFVKEVIEPILNFAKS
jgi:hypothetical protein